MEKGEKEREGSVYHTVVRSNMRLRYGNCGPNLPIPVRYFLCRTSQHPRSVFILPTKVEPVIPLCVADSSIDWPAVTQTKDSLVAKKARYGRDFVHITCYDFSCLFLYQYRWKLQLLRIQTKPVNILTVRGRLAIRDPARMKATGIAIVHLTANSIDIHAMAENRMTRTDKEMQTEMEMCQ